MTICLEPGVTTMLEGLPGTWGEGDRFAGDVLWLGPYPTEFLAATFTKYEAPSVNPDMV